MSETNIVRVMPRKMSLTRRKRTARRMRAKGYSEVIIREQVWRQW